MNTGGLLIHFANNCQRAETEVNSNVAVRRLTNTGLVSKHLHTTVLQSHVLGCLEDRQGSDEGLITRALRQGNLLLP